MTGETELTAKQAEAFAEAAQSMQWTLNKDEASKREFAAGLIPRDSNAVMKECLDVAIPSWELTRSFIVYFKSRSSLEIYNSISYVL